MGGRQRYTHEFRESAVRLVVTEGRRPADAAANLGMPVNTLIAVAFVILRTLQTQFSWGRCR